MEISKFHLNLLGRHRNQTPQDYWLTDSLRTFYAGFNETPLVRGFDSSSENFEFFLGAYVAALAQTEGVYPVYIILPKVRLNWALNACEQICRHVFKIRKGQKDGIAAVREASLQIRISNRALNKAEPERWTMYGFTSDDPLLPDWAKGRLLKV